jgi:hypothetical protein
MENEYRPIDLSPHANGGLDLLADVRVVPTGQQQFHGLPFLIGQGERAFVALGRGLGDVPIRVEIGARARNLIFAQRLLESSVLDGGPVGVAVADYVLHYADGGSERRTIRERFEIAQPNGWGQHAFLALPDGKNHTIARWEGSWGDAGRRQTETEQGSPRSYYLWCWPNPRPEAEIAALEVVPRGPRFLLAALTLGQADEHPFVRDGAQPVRVELKDAALAAGRLDLEVAVDRGTSGYAWPLPAAAPEEFLADGFAGWGEPLNQTNSPAYAEVAAVPSATVEISAGGQTVEKVRWGDLLERGQVETARARIALVAPARNWVETVVLDDATGQPIPCRVHFRSPEGVPYQPHGHHGHVNSNLGTWHVDVGGDLRLGQISYAYVDGRCQGWLPRGQAIVDVARGFEYEPLRQRVEIADGQRRLELRLKRWTDMNARRWFSGDTHVHFLSTQGGHREAQGEDLNVVNLLLSQWGSLFTNTEEFTGEPTFSQNGRTIVWATQENRQHLLGHLTLLGLRRPVYPWCSDGPSEAELGGTLETTMAAWADACHAQGGTVILPHLPNPNGEPAALIATGRVDGVEMIRDGVYQHLEYYRYLNAGYRLPIVGGTDKMSSEVAVGQYRTYVRVPEDEEFSYQSWCRNLALGRTFLSGGPLIELSVEGAEIGDTVQLPASGGEVEVVATVRSTIPIHTLQIVAGGAALSARASGGASEVLGDPSAGAGYRVLAQTDEPAGARELRVRARVRVEGHTWLCARAAGPGYQALPHRDVWSRGAFAHTSPIYVACGGDYALADPAGLQYMLTLVDGSLEYIRHLAPHDRTNRTLHHHGEPDHQAFLERPFLEAREAIHRRLHQLGVAH